MLLIDVVNKIYGEFIGLYLYDQKSELMPCVSLSASIYKMTFDSV